ncbi:YgiW/YdeI family stress tolerance OB fold protein [Pseudescherichia vulneris]|uniref:YgiW/YdeI family stress tolerance OB fold protein n=1 Tax=Pseudescherichia vulneris TaxID=566 RepID=UPI00227A50BB|nr:NirD/YgiW/YdeI family stress tolerance protein [Pseudescherichia vulneris]WAH54198.1 YgiW/YdeI family stress tolerance OB fold protein [Pseudescherichia vulneris]
MKKFAAIVAITMLASASVFAAEGGFNGPSAMQNQTQNQAQPGGFVDNSVSPTTAAKAKDLKDDSWVKLRGNITERLSDDRYVFRDASGTVNVEIEQKRWNGQNVTPQDQVEIQGKVDKDWNEFEIEVKQITKLAK